MASNPVNVATIMQAYTPPPQLDLAEDTPVLVPPVAKSTDVTDLLTGRVPASTTPVADPNLPLPIKQTPTKTKRKFPYIKRSSQNVY